MIIRPRVRLAITAALFVGWLGWLGYAAMNKSRGPIVSRAQAAAATAAVVATIEPSTDGRPAAKAVVITPLTAGGPPAGTAIFVSNLPTTHGFDGPGPYLLLLTSNPEAQEGKGEDGKPIPLFSVVGQQASPGYDSLAGVGSPLIYRWSHDVEAQARRLLPQ